MWSVIRGLLAFFRHGAVRHNTEHWYFDRKPIGKRIQQWFIWIGGWEKPNGEGWQFRRYSYGRGLVWQDPTPISLFGHRITFFGDWLQIKRYRRGHITAAWGPHRHYAYISQDGTPNRADCWFWGAPREVIAAAQRHDTERQQQKQEQAEREMRLHRDWEAATAERKAVSA